MSLPTNAKRVFKGVIFDVYHWQQKMFDGSLQTFEMLKRSNSILVLPIVGDKILISREEQPGKDRFLCLLGGRQEEGEEPLDAAKRELLEESGLVSQSWELWKTYEPNSKIDSCIHVFIAKDCEKKAEPHLDSGEKIELVPLNFGALLALANDEDFKDMEVRIDLFRMILDPALAKEFRKKLFPRNTYK